MSDSLVFLMGEFEARFPTDRQYARNHMWALPVDDRWRFGFAAYAVRLLQDVYFLDWTIDAPAQIHIKQEMGAIESKKAESTLYAPATGNILHFNEELLADPSAINVDKYGNGWLFEMQAVRDEFLAPEEYIEYLGEVWEVTQRTIKGQMNE